MDHCERPQVPGVASAVHASTQAVGATAVRPAFALEGREDEVYHELRLPTRGRTDLVWEPQLACRLYNHPAPSAVR